MPSHTSPSPPKILLFGSGAVGTIYLWLLSKVSRPTAVCRSNYSVAKDHGFVIHSAIFGRDIRFNPEVVRSCEEAVGLGSDGSSIANAAACPTATATPSATPSPSEPFDYVIVCSKAIPDTIPSLIAPAITSRHTVIVLVQNGVGIEAEYRAAFPLNPIVSAVVYLPATQRPAGVISHGEIERLEVGAYPASAESRHARAFAELVQAAGGTALFCHDVQMNRWVKLLVNASWNPICALSRSKDTAVLQSCDEATDVVRAVMHEICAVAASQGYEVSAEEAEFQLGRAQARIPIQAGIEPSMLQDVQGGRRLEVEAIVGNVVRMGREKGVPCVRLEMLYVLAKTLDGWIAGA